MNKQQFDQDDVIKQLSHQTTKFNNQPQQKRIIGAIHKRKVLRKRVSDGCAFFVLLITCSMLLSEQFIGFDYASSVSWLTSSPDILYSTLACLFIGVLSAGFLCAE